MTDFSKIKMIIWDLDDTFWKGTLSEGPVNSIAANIQLVKDLTDRGIVNTICSKNDFAPTVQKLQELGIDDYFVFKSIDWSPKGQRIHQLIKVMGLRPVNCLFLDDNVVNLNEARFYSEDLMIAEPSEISQLIAFCSATDVTDIEHKRLNQYKVLEEKQKAKAEAGDNLQFLYASNTRVEIHHDCKKVTDRIFELINRTNQLNFTKNRCTREELEAILNDSDANCGYITVKDNFGDYGIVGFYAIVDNKCLHFLFSCRTIGQGVEQWVYSTIGFPELDVVGEVVNSVERVPAPEWINQDELNENNKSDNFKNSSKILLKGACDLQILSTFLQSENIVEEFTYIGINRKNMIEHHNHSVNILNYPFIPISNREEHVTQYIFNDIDMYDTVIYDDDLSLVFLSTQIEPNLGLYRNVHTGNMFAFGEFLYPLTDQTHWSKYINNEIFCGKNEFTEEWLMWFKANHEFIGRMTPAMMVENYKEIIKKISPSAKLCLILGSEIPYDNNCQEAYVDRHIIYKSINAEMRKFAKENDRVLLLDMNDFIHSQDDFLDNINHYKRYVYYNASIKANEIIRQSTGIGVKNKNIIHLYLWQTQRFVKDIIKIFISMFKL